MDPAAGADKAQYESGRCMMRVAAIILSGGKGLRAGTKIPKQYMEIRGKTILGYTIDAFEKSRVDEIIIVAAEEYLDQCFRIAEQCESSRAADPWGSNGSGEQRGNCKVTAVISGGSERYYSVLNGLRYLAGQLPCETFKRTDNAKTDEKLKSSYGGTADLSAGVVLIHDGARPFIRPEVINEIIRCVEEGTAAIAAAPCTDTIKIADADGCIISTTERARTWAAQTPQAFRTEEIYEAYEKIIGGKAACSSASGLINRSADCSSDPDGSRTNIPAGITDDAMVYQMAFPDKPVHLINAGTDNFKITTAEDLLRAESLLRD